MFLFCAGGVVSQWILGEAVYVCVCVCRGGCEGSHLWGGCLRGCSVRGEAAPEWRGVACDVEDSAFPAGPLLSKRSCLNSQAHKGVGTLGPQAALLTSQVTKSAPLDSFLEIEEFLCLQWHCLSNQTPPSSSLGWEIAAPPYFPYLLVPVPPTFCLNLPLLSLPSPFAFLPSL